MATPSSIPAWKIQGTEEPGLLQPTGLQRARHDSESNTVLTTKVCLGKRLY